MFPDAPLLLFAFPILGASIALVSKAMFRDQLSVAVEWLAVGVGLVLPFGLLAYLLPSVFHGDVIEGFVGGWQGELGIRYRFDGLAWALNALGFTLALPSWLYMRGKSPKGPGITAAFLIQAGALAAGAMTSDLFNLFVCLEMMGIASYVLVASSQKDRALLASFTYLMVSATAMVFFLIGLYGFYRISGSLDYQTIARSLAEQVHQGQSQGAWPSTWLIATGSLTLICASVAIRVAIMPVYGWLPDAHAMAPHGISAVLSGVLIKTPLFALWRILSIMPGGPQAGQLLGYAGAATAVIAVIIALSQKDIKSLLAYHSISQIGYITAAWGAALASLPSNVLVGADGTLLLDGGVPPVAAMLLAAALLHAFYHALFKGLLFLSLGSTADALGSRDVYKLGGVVCLLRQRGDKLGILSLGTLVGALSIAAIPPFNGYVSKSLISQGLDGTWQYYALTAAAVGTVASFLKVLRMFLPERSPKEPEQDGGAESPCSTDKKLSFWELLGVGLLALASLSAAVWGTRAYGFVLLLLGHGSLTLPSLFAAKKLLSTLFIVLGGIALYALSRTKAAALVQKRIRNRTRTFQGLFAAFVFGAAGLFAWIIWI